MAPDVQEHGMASHVLMAKPMGHRHYAACRPHGRDTPAWKMSSIGAARPSHTGRHTNMETAAACEMPVTEMKPRLRLMIKCEIPKNVQANTVAVGNGTGKTDMPTTHSTG